MSTLEQFYGTGRRKSSVARVYLRPGSGQVIVNKRPVENYFQRNSSRQLALSPLALTNTLDQFDVLVNVSGGGVTGQAGAIRHGLTRALIQFKPELRTALKRAGFVTRDAREVERKKYGQPKARKHFQFSKR